MCTRRHNAATKIQTMHRRRSAAKQVDEMRATQAAEQAQAEATLKHERLSTLFDRIEERHSSHRAIASELVQGFLMPEVQRQQERRAARLEEQKYANAARRTLAGVVDTVEAALTQPKFD